MAATVTAKPSVARPSSEGSGAATGAGAGVGAATVEAGGGRIGQEPAGRLPQGDGETGEQQHERRWAGEEPGLAAGHQQREDDEQDQPAHHASRGAARRPAGDEHQPEPGVEHDADPAGERQHHEPEPHPQRVDAEAAGDEAGDTTEDVVAGRRRRGRWAAAEEGRHAGHVVLGEAHATNVRLRAARNHRGCP